MSPHASRAALAFALFAAACNNPPPSQDAPATSSSAARATPPAAASSAQKPQPKPGDLPAPDDVATPPADAQKTASGLVSKVLLAPTGKQKPGANDRVKVSYTGWTKDGIMFDSSVVRGQPVGFGVGEVIKGWTEALQLMSLGEKRRVWIPAALAYGESPRRGAPAGDLTFDIELHEIKPAPAVPTDLKEPPKDAKKTKSGFTYKILTSGKGKDHPKEKDNVTVVYSGWTPADGKMFDSSTNRDEPAYFVVNGTIKGWTEGLQLLVVGDKARFWIPADLAYGDKPTRPGVPAGPLVFDVELVAINQAPKPQGGPQVPQGHPLAGRLPATGPRLRAERAEVSRANPREWAFVETGGRSSFAARRRSSSYVEHANQKAFARPRATSVACLVRPRVGRKPR
jgi:peptidylprolyl isomerase